MLQNSHFVAFLSSESVGDVDHEAARRRSNLRYCSSVIVRFTARTPLQRSRGHPIVAQVSEALRSMGIRRILPFSRRQEPGACRRICLPFAPSLAPKLDAQRHSMKLGIRILLHRSRLQQELRAIYRADFSASIGGFDESSNIRSAVRAIHALSRSHRSMCKT